MAEQATQAARKVEVDTEGNNAVTKICFLEGRRNNAATGKIYVYICLLVFEKGSKKGFYCLGLTKFVQPCSLPWFMKGWRHLGRKLILGRVVNESA